MRTRILMTLMLWVNFSFAQTKSETQEWIKEKIELFAYSNDIDIFNNYKLEYIGESLIITEAFKSTSGGITVEYKKVNTIPIKFLSQIRFEDKGDTFWMFIKIKNGDKLIKSKVDFEDNYSFIDKVTVVLEKDFSTDNMPNRMTKAFNHLIQLYGGSITPEKF